MPDAFSILTTPNEYDRATFARNLGLWIFHGKSPKKKVQNLTKGGFCVPNIKQEEEIF
jgi:hypothetical protein